MLEFFQKLSLKLTDLETKEVVDSLYSLYECCRLLSCQKESLYQSQSLKFEIMCYLCKSKLAANIFPFMLHVSFDCLYSPKTNVNLQMKGADFIQWITRTADTSIVELIGKVLLFGLLEIIKETRIEKFNNLIREQEIIQTLLFKPFYGSPDLPIHNSEEAIDNEILKVIIIKFRELDQLDQFNQWANEEDVQAIINILEENIDESSHTIICCILKYAFNLFPFAPILKKIQSSNFFNIANLIYEKSTKCAHQNGVGTTRDLQKANIWYKMYREKSSVSNEWMCWENDPEKRPSAAEVCGTFAEWQNDKKILFELNEYDKKMRQLMKGQLSINDNSKLSIVINNEVNYSKEIYTDRFFSFITSHPTSNHLESNADLLIINSKELIPENLD
ncbi:ARM repeat-containing protein [Gigaspora margarita]|uniref:ARM repeat-containing protein n=1 Tax=Gigaspora margarita TaxID=4874 RepID=A0A8H4EQ80_GIGMA|nr:ARM repeat-containing protein [Gigaspora margarita]